MSLNPMTELTIALIANPEASNEAIAAILARKGLTVGVGTMNTTRSSTRRTLAALAEVEKRQKRNAGRARKAA